MFTFLKKHKKAIVTTGIVVTGSALFAHWIYKHIPLRSSAENADEEEDDLESNTESKSQQVYQEALDISRSLCQDLADTFQSTLRSLNGAEYFAELNATRQSERPLTPADKQAKIQAFKALSVQNFAMGSYSILMLCLIEATCHCQVFLVQRYLAHKPSAHRLKTQCQFLGAIDKIAAAKPSQLVNIVVKNCSDVLERVNLKDLVDIDDMMQLINEVCRRCEAQHAVGVMVGLVLSILNSLPEMTPDTVHLNKIMTEVYSSQEFQATMNSLISHSIMTLKHSLSQQTSFVGQIPFAKAVPLLSNAIPNFINTSMATPPQLPLQVLLQSLFYHAQIQP